MRNREGQDGVTTVEATIGILLLLYATLFAVQVVLVMHGALAAYAAAGKAARAVALSGSVTAAAPIFQQQQATALRSLVWLAPSCSYAKPAASCTATVYVPVVLPGGGLFFGGGGSLGSIRMTEIGRYPTSDIGG